jgi:hypothetical protein
MEQQPDGDFLFNKRVQYFINDLRKRAGIPPSYQGPNRVVRDDPCAKSRLQNPGRRIQGLSGRRAKQGYKETTVSPSFAK